MAIGVRIFYPLSVWWCIMKQVPVPKNIKPPHMWNKYKNPIHNLLYGILLQAAFDNNGYVNEHIYHTGDDAIDFLQSDGELYISYLNREGERI